MGSNPTPSARLNTTVRPTGGMTERPKVAVLKTVGHPCLVGSNPTPSAPFLPRSGHRLELGVIQRGVQAVGSQ